MKKRISIIMIQSLFLFLLLNCAKSENNEMDNTPKPAIKTIKLPAPKTDGGMSVEKALVNRKSRRSFKNEPLSIEQLSQILWSAQGIVRNDFFRTTPSAGAKFGLELYIVVGNVTNLENGIYKYIPKDHSIVMLEKGEFRKNLCSAAWEQIFIEQCPFTVVIAAVYERVTKKYGERGIMYTHQESGHAGQNIYLQAESMGLGTCAVGAFVDKKVKDLLKMNADETPIYMFPIGIPDEN